MAHRCLRGLFQRFRTDNHSASEHRLPDPDLLRTSYSDSNSFHRYNDSCLRFPRTSLLHPGRTHRSDHSTEAVRLPQCNGLQYHFHDPSGRYPGNSDRSASGSIFPADLRLDFLPEF